MHCDYNDDSIIVEYTTNIDLIESFSGRQIDAFFLEKSISSILSWNNFSVNDYLFEKTEPIIKTIKKQKIKGFRLTLVPIKKGK